MELPLFSYILLSLAVSTVASHAALSPELYWETVLPNTPMPESIKALLQTETLEEDSTSVNVAKGTGVNVNTGNGKPGGTSVNVGKGGVNVHAGKGTPGGTSVGVGKGGVSVNTGKGTGTTVGVGKGGVSVNTGPKRKGVHVAVGGGKGYESPFNYQYDATETQLHDDPNVVLFFLEKDLRPGTTMSLHFPQTDDTATFLPRKVADTIPFSSNKFPEILNRFQVKPDSVEAETMKNTIDQCEQKGIKGEDKYCATSLESMIDYSTSKLGRDVLAISTEVQKPTQTEQKYTIAGPVKSLASDQTVACHKQEYAYAVFYCHESRTTKPLVIRLVGADGSKVEAAAVCHTDTSAWNPKHLAFQVLKVQPGSVPVCHFLPQDHIVWASKRTRLL